VENIAFNDAAHRVGLLVHMELPSKYEVSLSYRKWFYHVNKYTWGQFPS
jgi:hypothetical protein